VTSALNNDDVTVMSNFRVHGQVMAAVFPHDEHVHSLVNLTLDKLLARTRRTPNMALLVVVAGFPEMLRYNVTWYLVPI
jgi:hypothetical protein